MARGISRLKFELRTKSGHEFQALFAILLGELMDGTAQTKRLGRLDQMGLDAITISDDGLSLKTAIQCKGFELLEYGPDQQKQCKDELAKYKQKGPPVAEYWLVVNRPVKDRDMRQALEGDLQELIASGKAKKTFLLDSNRMMDMLQKLAGEKLVEWGDEKRRQLFEYYKDRMEFVQYIPDVPFNKDQRHPVDHIYKRIRRFFDGLPATQTSKYRKPPKILVTSEFGFGKTSTLQAFASEWIRGGGRLVYVPAALMDASAFTNTAGLADALLPFLMPEDADVSELALEVFRDTLRFALAKSTDWLVLIDGLDESEIALIPNRLAGLWNSMSDLGVPAVVSIRDEVIETRTQEFFPDQKLRIGPKFERLRLDDWPEDVIRKFVDLFSETKEGSEPDSYAAFRKVIESGRYSDFYGDIPKRPLFLGMLADDAWAGEEPERQLHRLYGQYFRKKFTLDRRSMAARGTANRPSAIVDALGMDEAAERLIRVMQDAADDMLEIKEDADGGSAVHRDTIGESRLRSIAEANAVPFATMEDVAMHSLLQPAGRDAVTRERLMRFAHRSFQEWFLARQYVEKERKLYLGLPRTVVRFINAMQSDLENGGSLP